MKKNEKIIRKDIEYRYKLLPYIYSSIYESHLCGIPLSRTLAINYSHNPEIFGIRYQNQFLFGSCFLVAPVASTNTSCEVYLPGGIWYRLSSGERYNGDEHIEVYAPLNDLPVFIKEGSIIPMQSVIQNTSEKGDGLLEVHIWNGSDVSEFVYYEDDGSSYDYQSGCYYKRKLVFDPKNRHITMTAVEGSYRSRFDTIKLFFHGFDDSFNTLRITSFEPQTVNRGRQGHFHFTNKSEEIRISF